MNTSFLKSLEEYKNRCDSFFSGEEASKFFDCFNLNSVMKNYIDTFIKHSIGGKRIRAYLTYLAYSLYSKDENLDKVFLPSLSYELFQTGILAHDDIIDKSDFRRHKPSMHVDLGNGHEGVSKSICVGDFGIVSAIEIINKSDFDDAIKLKAISHQNNIFSSTIAGELRDIELSYNDNTCEKQILDMYLLKTARYTVSGPMVLGAILADADKSEIENLRCFGDSVGISFQIKDDILGMFGDEKTLGKSVLSDMREGKKTILVSYFLDNADESSIAQFKKMYGNPDSTEQDLEIVRTLLVETQSLAYAENMCKTYVNVAEKMLDTLNVSDEHKDILEGFLEYMTNRNY